MAKYFEVSTLLDAQVAWKEVRQQIIDDAMAMMNRRLGWLTDTKIRSGYQAGVLDVTTMIEEAGLVSKKNLEELEK